MPQALKEVLTGPQGVKYGALPKIAIPGDDETLLRFAEELLDETKLKVQGYLNPGPIRQKWTEHLSRRRNWQYELWCVLMFQAWMREQRL